MREREGALRFCLVFFYVDVQRRSETKEKRRHGFKVKRNGMF